MPTSAPTILPNTRRFSLARTTGLIVGLTAVVAIADMTLSRHNLNVASFYMIPMILGAQHFRKSANVLWLAIALIVLNYVGFGFSWYIGHPTDSLRPDVYRVLNRGFVALALAGACMLAVFYLRLRDYWLTRQSALAPSDEEVSFLLQVFQMFEDIISGVLACTIAAVTFYIDLSFPQEYNFAILHLVSLALLAITRNRTLLWSAVPVLIALSYAGFVFGPASKITSPDFLTAIAFNRTFAVVAMVLAAALFHLTGAKPHDTAVHKPQPQEPPVLD